jgi:hypothetical protein
LLFLNPVEFSTQHSQQQTPAKRGTETAVTMSEMISHIDSKYLLTEPGRFRLAPLSYQRFQDLLSSAGSFFASFESDPAAEKAAAIAEIQALMGRYGLTAEDL